MSDLIQKESKHPVSREQIMELEDAIRTQLPPVDFNVLTKHHFADGIYLREVLIPAGMVAVGKIHKTRHLTIIASGTVRITTEEGVKEITGPAVFVSEPGTKKAAFAVTDTVVMNPHPNEENTQNMSKLEERLIAPSFDAIESENLELLKQEK
jgi:hypothetical protein